MQNEETKEYISMVDELRHAFELAQQQPEEMQRYLAELITHELSSEEVAVTPELVSSHCEIDG
jgi:ubiquinone biosynthesis protein UbiJ